MTTTQRSLDGRVAIVTGGGRGIGLGVALALGAEGASVAVAGGTESTIDDACRLIQDRGTSATPIVCDVREFADTERLVATVVERLGRLDILVEQRSDVPARLLVDTTEDDIGVDLAIGPARRVPAHADRPAPSRREAATA